MPGDSDSIDAAAILSAALAPALAPLVAHLESLHVRLDAVHEQSARAEAELAAVQAENRRLREQLETQSHLLAGVVARLDELLAGHASKTAASAASASAAGATSRPEAAASGMPAARAAGSGLVSEWDRLPEEIQVRLLGRAGALTLFINGQIKQLGWDLFKAIWSEAFQLDWQGDLSRLPVNHFKSNQWFESFWTLHTRSMHARVKALGHAFLDNGLDQAAICNWWTDLLDFGRARELSINAVSCGSIAMLKHLVDDRRIVTLDDEHARHAACFGHLEMLKWLAARMPNVAWTTTVMDWAASNGHLDCVRWLSAHRAEGCTTYAMNWASKNGHLDVVVWLHSNRVEGCTTDAMDWAAGNGHQDILEFLHKNRTEGCTRKAILRAAKEGHADIVEFLYRNRSEGNIAETAKTAARCGNIQVVKRIYAIAPDALTPAIADEASASGHTGLLEWVVESTSVRPTDEAISRAAKSGHLRMLPWFRTHIPAAFRSHPMSRTWLGDADSAIVWMGRSDLPGDLADVLRLAMKEHHIDVIRWLLWHLPDAKWHEGDVELARGMVRIAG
ncbi:hypothetical protein HK105_201785 [Polyrhizophydium stewartii]|uniref:Ankyrin repeat protein n=1 Tax=Polyrhizophydium stewartii TaxID=2732419 RepID=A0ABR4NFU1_9FUNG|nr:hypothetical protein HK105_007035 [Polyrhizophydium stewartii]